MSEFDRQYPHARTKSGKPWWPAGIRSISLEGLDLLGVDDEGAVYWNGNPLKVAKRLDLTFWQALGAVLVTASTVAMAAVEVLTYVHTSLP